MNEIRRQRVADLQRELQEVQARIYEVMASEQEAHANLPDGIEHSRYGESIGQSIGHLTEAADDLGPVIALLELARA